MILHHQTADRFFPDGAEPAAALSRVTHLGIGAHHDDLEFMALHGVIACFHHRDGQWFGGVTCTDGTGSARAGQYAGVEPEDLRAIRREEQRAAAVVGRYAAMIQLDHASAAIKTPAGRAPLADDLQAILRATRPLVVYTHNPADKHETHLAVLAAAVEALRRLPRDQRPEKLIGCEGWRGLDWLGDDEKLLLDVSGHDHLAAALGGIFDSQIAGGKRYDLAVAGRRAANATFLDSHAEDRAGQITLAMDLTPLLTDDALDPAAYALAFVDRFREDVRAKLAKFFPTAP